jgi:predicted nucleic acid-binding Zn finger protein
MNKQISRVWTFASDSNPNIEYETLQYGDGSTSCNCKGWTRRVAADGSRPCKHTRYVDMGIADQNCTATDNYEPNNQQQQIRHAKYQQRQVFQIPKLGHCKFAV